MKNILVTGGLGFIGSHTVVELQKVGFRVVIIDNLSNSKIEVLEQIKFITNLKPSFYNIDIRNKEALKSFFDTEKVDGIIHFAALKSVSESVQKPKEYFENNVNGLANLLAEIKNRNLNNLIFSSSCTVYGQADELPITENAALKPAESTYGETKQMGEKIINESCVSNNLDAIALRYFNPIGAHESAEIGELPLGVPQNLIPYVTQTAAGIREQLSVFGEDYPTKDGTAIRDYIHVVDLAKAHISALERLINKKNKSNFEVFNIGTGKGTSVLEIIQTFEKITNQKLNYKIVERRSGDVTSAYADTTLAFNELNWKTEKTLEEALKSAWNWQQKQL
ncbi:UDP-glucose 4-epimerase GalE [Tenacibaculum sp. 1_MG-2023]|uniref:UDP-glucose 4-epimerase GalE n=1 Tax=Tenacibaculum sp. 1_MG-2023 TaxID=3062653 RepID=UPI0026E3E8F3|nr:UDP-glucose 4-epimerase GalE [Tenacibaculum sp. 1_MG-2023]MDO6598560.1 UDP-glucose 4-epimerase GalE [Tenacibaculum sp. 1_MG-2023]